MFTGTTLLKKSFLSYEILPLPTKKETGSCTFLLSNKLYHWFLLSIELTSLLQLYFHDCLSLPIKYPLIYESFLDGEFVVKLKKRSISTVPMDQALESKYNKPAKSASGIIGIMHKKEAVRIWNLMTH